jgi:gliotoxin/aspirochlorine biosynthesis peptide synthetase
MEQQPEIDEDLLERLCSLLHLEPKHVKLNETFIRNGGDSLLAIKFSNLVQVSEHVHIGAGVILRAKNLCSLLDKTQLRKLATGHFSKSSQSDNLLLAASNQSQHDDKTLDSIQRIPTVIPTAGLPLTFIQAGVAVYTHHVPGAAVQHVTQYCYTDALPQLKSSFGKAMSQYRVFRLKYEVETSPLLVTATLKETFKLNWAEQQVESLEETDLEESFRVWSLEASGEPVFRVVTPCKTLGERKLSILHWFYHHSLLDGRSLDILLRQVDAFFSIPPLSVEVNDSIFDVVRGLEDYHRTREAAARAFWATREVYGGARNHPLLQTLGERSSSRVRMRSIDVFYPEDLKVFSARTGFTFEILVRAALGLVLSKLQSTSTVSLMSVSSRRSLPIKGIEHAVGCIATSMILTMDVNGNDTAHDFLEQVFEKVLELDDMSYSNPSDGFSLGGLVVVSSDLQPHCPWYAGGHQTEVMAPKETLPTLYVSPTGRLRFSYNSEWRSPSEMHVMTDLFKSALVSLASGTLRVGECLRSMLPNSQKTRILDWGNCFSPQTSLESIDDDITSLFQKQALERDGEAALQLAGQKTSYNIVKEMVRAVGQRLRKMLKPRSVVLIHADGSVNWVIAMFAVLWADCIFSPQGVSLPHQLRSDHYAIVGAQAFLVPQEDTDTLAPNGCKLKLCVETILREVKERQQNGYDEATIRQPKPLSPAYICFSSGSTGKPKAIQCTHSGVVGVLRSPVARLHVGPGHRVAQTLAPAFDGALLEVFSALCYGGTLILKDPREPFEHLRVADSLLTTPSLAAELNPEDYPNLKYIYLCSEVLPQQTADRWSAGQANTYNIYGPTECHMVASAQEVKPGQYVTIGAPFLSTRYYILDQQGALCPPLVAGEIHIAGVQVSQGYIGLQEETKQRFIPDTIWPTDDGRMYRTGDWGYWTLDGQVAFIGRTDRQVKLLGFRIDLNDVQARLENAISTKVRVAIVVVGDALACAISDGHNLSEEQVKAAAETVLPPQSVPKVIRFLEAMPVSPFGKIDYRAIAKLLE